MRKIMVRIMSLLIIALTGLTGCLTADTIASPPKANQVPVAGQLNELSTRSLPEGASTPSPETTPTAETGPQIGKLAPDFTFRNPDGKSISLRNLRGSSIVLNFWTTWCGPCKSEMPILQKLANDKEKTGKGLMLITVNVGEPADTVRDFLIKTGYSFTVLLDIQKKITYAYNVRSYPNTFFIGADGIIDYIKIGAFTRESDLEQIVDKLLNPVSHLPDNQK